MPFTPFHLGIGIAAKAVAPRHMSLQVFTLTQVAMDIEPGILMARGADQLHGWTHTLYGAIPVALVSMALWRLLENRRIYRWTLEPVSAASLTGSAIFGVWSHVALDAFIHADMTSTRELLGLAGLPLLTHEMAQWGCVVAAFVGASALAIRLSAQDRRTAFQTFANNVRAAPAWFVKASCIK